MKHATDYLTFETPTRRDYVNITDQVDEFVRRRARSARLDVEGAEAVPDRGQAEVVAWEEASAGSGELLRVESTVHVVLGPISRIAAPEVAVQEPVVRGQARIGRVVAKVVVGNA